MRATKNQTLIFSVQNIIRLLLFETIIGLLILVISLIYGEGIKIWMLIALLSIAFISIFTAFGLWRFRNKYGVRLVVKLVSVIILIPVAILVKTTLPLIILGGYYLGVAFVIICLINGLTIWTISCLKRKKA